MAAAVLVAPGQVELQEFPVPTIGPSDAVLAVEGSGVCGADWSAYKGSLRWLEGRRVILGHEVVGTIARIGAGAAARWGVGEGDRVVVEEPIPCGTCRDCLAGSYHWCGFGLRFGATDVDTPPSLFGGYAEAMHLPPQSMVHRMSSAVPVEQATLFIPIANGLHWVQTAGGAVAGSTVLVEGPGQHGLGTVVAARHIGAGCVIVTGTAQDSRRLEVAKALGADHTINVDGEDVVARVREITAGRLADVVVNVAPSARALELAVDLAARRGTIVNAGESGEGATISPDRLIRKELTIRGVAGRPHQAVAAAVRIIEAGEYPLELLCSHSFGLEETEAAIRAVGRVDRGDDVLHVTVTSTRAGKGR